DMAESYDGNVLHFRISKEDAESRYMTDSPPAASTQERTTTSSMPRQERTEEETTVPLTEERLDVSKKASAREATITKEPMTETKSVEVPVTHEEISIERRPASGSTKADSPVQSRTETKVPLKSEEVQVTKQPYAKEEVSVKKKPVTETKTVGWRGRSIKQ
ncbi:MAG: YsnF/AvaK domain-containing protein, partial [Nitrososphaeraceae archaeon]